MPGRPRKHALQIVLAWYGLLFIAFGLRQCRGPDSDAGSAHDRSQLQQENAQLAEENRQLRALHALVASQVGKLHGFAGVPVQVHPGLELSPRARSRVISAGARQGLRVGQGVICELGIVGIVAEVSEDAARVRLADDPQFCVEFRRGTVYGIVAGGPDPDFLQPRFVQQEPMFEPGDLLTTTGTDGVFPPGILIGSLERVGVPYHRSRVKLAAPMATLDVAIVLLPPDQKLKRTSGQ
ncbi:MAG: rod shape-determining protein MreC [Planctomycetota bacterium]